jgi:hypothetical protein
MRKLGASLETICPGVKIGRIDKGGVFHEFDR